MNRSTLSRTLFWRITPTIIVTIAVIGGFAFLSTTREIDSMYDAQLLNNANVLWSLLEDEFREEGADTPKKIQDIELDLPTTLMANDDADEYANARMFRIWRSDKVMMFADTSLPDSVPQQPAGFSYVTYEHESWRIFSLPIAKTPFTIEVGEKVSLRDALVENILLDLFGPLLVLIPIVGALVWLGITNGLGTIRSLVEQIRTRSPEDLSAIALEHLPRDLFPLGKSINQLLSKLESSLTAERRFADYAAHQLRTPLTGLKLQLQMLAKADHEDERAGLITDLTLSIDRSTRLIEQLLRAARISHQPITWQTVNLYQATASVLAQMGHIATQKHIDLSLEGHEQALTHADEPMLHLMISNLVENAIKYTPVAGSVHVTIREAEAHWCLCIIDTGPGIAASERDAVFHRFYRAGNSGHEGVGLGLSIVADILERLSGSITLSTPDSGQGLQVEVRLAKA